MLIKSFVFLLLLSLGLEAGPFRKSAVIDAFKDYKKNQPVTKPKLVKGLITQGAKPSKIDTLLKNRQFTGATKLPKQSVLTKFKSFKNAQTKKRLKVPTPVTIIKRKPKVVMPVTVKRPIDIKTLKLITLPTGTTTTTFKTFKPKTPTIVKPVEPKATVIKNSNLSTTVKIGNVDVKGKLNVSNINVAKGAEIKNSNITTNVNAKNISVSKDANSDIGSVNIEK